MHEGQAASRRRHSIAALTIAVLLAALGLATLRRLEDRGTSTELEEGPAGRPMIGAGAIPAPR